MNEYGYIYKIVNDIDDMVYIGKTINPKEDGKDIYGIVNV